MYRCDIVDHDVPRIGFVNDADYLEDSISFKVNIPVLLRGVRLFGHQGETYFVKLNICGETVFMGQFQKEVELKDGHYGFDIIFSFAKCRELTPGVPCILKASIIGPQSYTAWDDVREEVICDKVTFRFNASHYKQERSTTSKGQFAQILFTYP